MKDYSHFEGKETTLIGVGGNEIKITVALMEENFGLTIVDTEKPTCNRICLTGKDSPKSKKYRSAEFECSDRMFSYIASCLEKDRPILGQVLTNIRAEAFEIPESIVGGTGGDFVCAFK